MIEPIEKDLELNAVAYAFSKILQPEPTNFNSSFGDRELLSFVCFTSEATTETKKENFPWCERFHILLVAFRNTTTYREGETRRKLDLIDEEARVFWGSDVKTKHRRLTNLAFMRLVLGADRAVRHICIRCMGIEFLCKTIIDWVSNESVGFPAFNFVVRVTNFVAASCHSKNSSLSHVSLYRQLQTSWLDMLRQFFFAIV